MPVSDSAHLGVRVRGCLSRIAAHKREYPGACEERAHVLRLDVSHLCVCACRITACARASYTCV